MDSLTSLRSASVAAEAAAIEKKTSESRVDSDSHFNGLYKTKQNLRIEGIAEGEIECDGTLTVAEGARVKATVTAHTITVAGELEGEVLCQGVFEILPSGQVEATVSAHRLVVQEGGLYNGEFHMITGEKKTEKPSAVKAPPVKVDETPTVTAEQPAEAETADDVVGSEEWWEKMTNPNPPANDSGDKPV